MEALMKNLRSVIGTVLFHILLLMILIFMGFSTPLPLPEESGIAINFGTTEDGLGEIESMSTQSTSTTSQNEEGYVTQDLEVTDPVKNQNNDKPNNTTQTNTTAEVERQVNQNALFPGNQFTGNGNEGETQGNGNQGDPNGDPNANSHVGTPGGTGNGNWNLNGRNLKGTLPKPAYTGNDQGKVIVEIFVDRQGRVTKAVAGIKGSTLNAKTYLDAAWTAAMKAQFDPNPDAPEVQKGTITYTFVLQ